MVRIEWFGCFSGKESRNRVHPTQKPTELASWFLTKFSREDDVVLDLFLGSGSTLIAAEKTGRICYGMELDPKYVDVIIKRYEQYTGNRAVKISGGETKTDQEQG